MVRRRRPSPPTTCSSAGPSGSGYFDDATLDEDRRAVTAGTQYFTHRGQHRRSRRHSTITEVADDKLSLTLDLRHPVRRLEPQALIGPARSTSSPRRPAWSSRSSSRPSSPAPRVTPPLRRPATRRIKAAADFWNTGFDMTSLPDDAVAVPLERPVHHRLVGAHAVDDAHAQRELQGRPQARVLELVIRFIGDSQAQVTALQNGEVDIISPQASGDTLTALRGIDGIQIHHRATSCPTTTST